MSVQEKKINAIQMLDVSIYRDPIRASAILVIKAMDLVALVDMKLL